ANEHIDIRTYEIIYDAINDVRDALEGMLAPEEKEEILGVAEVRELFRIPKTGTIAGSYILSGKISRNDFARIVREGVTIYEGAISSLKRFKDDVKDVATGYECGIGIQDFNDVKVGDTLEAFHIVETKAKLEA
ncbi:MAG: EF-Tu/IF-2/RF-3 family GTPase, partial [bacterium]